MSWPCNLGLGRRAIRHCMIFCAMILAAEVLGLMGSARSMPQPAAVRQPALEPASRPDGGLLIPLDPAAQSGSEIWEMFGGRHIVRNVTQPALTAFLPDRAIATGASVIVAPGGGFLMLSFDSEGVLIAQWLAQHGIAAFVLTYRLEKTPTDEAAFLSALKARIGAIAAGSFGPPAIDLQAPATIDGARAVRLVRQRAGDWGLDPHRVGFLGLSAGGMTATQVATAVDHADRPDFVGVIYGALYGAVPADAPPAFIAVASDDPLLGGASRPIFDAWKAVHRPAELHVFERGGHGFGLVPQGSSSDHWLEEFYWWLQSRGLLTASPPAFGR